MPEARPAGSLPVYPLALALESGVPFHIAEEAYGAQGLHLTREDAEGRPLPPVRMLLSWPNYRLRSNRGEWHAKRTHRGRTLTGYAGGHAPRGGGIPGLSAAGIARALDGLDRQAARRDAAIERARCPCCGRLPEYGAPLKGLQERAARQR